MRCPHCNKHIKVNYKNKKITCQKCNSELVLSNDIEVRKRHNKSNKLFILELILIAIFFVSTMLHFINYLFLLVDLILIILVGINAIRNEMWLAYNVKLEKMYQ